MRRRLLFVDDEPNVLAGLQRILRGQRHEWDMRFVGGGAEALAALAREEFDVIVSDMRMPGIDGAALLEEVSRSYPGIVRIVLSGQADREAILRVVGPAHQYLSKPCEAETVKAKLQQALVLREVLANPDLKSLVARLRSLPSVPSVYVELMREMRSEHATPQRVGAIIERDVALTAKILQLVNSAFFAVHVRVVTVTQAVQLLGVDLVRTLLLSTHIFSQLDGRTMERFRVAAMWRRSLAVNRFARVIARLERLESDATTHALTAAMLHDTGRLVLASCLPAEYGAVVDQAVASRRPLIDVEFERFGCTHAEVGAYLLALWGLPDQITSAVAWHHRPSQSGVTSVGPLALVHAGDAIANEMLMPSDEDAASPVDRAFLASLSARAGYDAWKSTCETEHAEHVTAGQARA